MPRVQHLRSFRAEAFAHAGEQSFEVFALRTSSRVGFRLALHRGLRFHCRETSPLAPNDDGGEHRGTCKGGVVRRSGEPSVAAFGSCSGFTNSLGHDGYCGTEWGASILEDGTGSGGVNQSPMLSTYGYAFSFVGDRAQLCRYYGDELGDEHGCIRGDVRCATSGELVIHDDGGGHIVGDFEGGGHIEAAFRFRFPVDAGVRADSGP